MSGSGLDFGRVLGILLGSILAPFWSRFGVVFDPLDHLGVSLDSLGVPLGLLRIPLDHFWCLLVLFESVFDSFYAVFGGTVDNI